MFRNKTNLLAVLILALTLLIAVTSLLPQAAASPAKRASAEPLQQVAFIIKTASYPDAGNDTDLLFRVRRSDGTVWEYYTPSENWNQFEPGRTEFVWSPDGLDLNLNTSNFSAYDVCIQEVGGDAWLPEYIIIIGKTYTEPYARLLNYNRNRNRANGWWISGEGSDGVNAVRSRNLNGEPCGF